MSQETLQWLNQNTLIGMTDKRGTAWHWRASEQGTEPNHYPGAIPVEHVRGRLFAWDEVSIPVSVLVPTDITRRADIPSGEMAVKMGEVYYVVRIVDNRQAITTSDKIGVHYGKFEASDVLGLPTTKYQPHSFSDALLNEPEKWFSDGLVISSAGLLKNRAVAWVEMSMPENRVIEGFEFRPNILAATSHNGSLSTTYKATVTGTVCDNTMSAALAEFSPQFKIKHSQFSLEAFDSSAIMSALGILEEVGDEYEQQAKHLLGMPVNTRQWEEFLTIFYPETDKTQASKASMSMIKNSREKLTTLYETDARVAPWHGTAFGVVQAVNTSYSHERTLKTKSLGGRAERLQLETLAKGFDALDRNTWEILSDVLA